jgi:DNA-directed RNA polymerase subunit L
MSIVKSFVVDRKEIDYSIPEISDALDDIMNVKGFKLPLAKEHITVMFEGVSTSVYNGIRRVINDEMKGKCLTFDDVNFIYNTDTDPFMADFNFIKGNLNNIKLNYSMSENAIKTLKFSLNEKNNTDSVMDIYSKHLRVSGGKLTAPIFNPTHQIAALQPGKSINIKNIYIMTGYGNKNALFNNACRAAGRPMDIKEYTSDSVNELPDEDSAGGSKSDTEDFKAGEYSRKLFMNNNTDAVCDQSGFKESSMNSNPQKHRMTAYIPAVIDDNGKSSKLIVIDACDNIMSRLRFIQQIVENSTKPEDVLTGASTSYYMTSIIETKKNILHKGVLNVKNETDTIGNLLARSIYDMEPDIAHCSYACIDHEHNMVLTVKNEVNDVSEIAIIIIKAIKQIYGTYNQIKSDISKLMR